MLRPRITFVLFFVFIVAAGALANWLEIYNSYIDKVLPGTKSPSAITFLSLWILTLIALACVYDHYLRQARYAEILQALYRIAVDIDRSHKQATKEDLEDKCKQIVNQLVSLMSRVTKKPCYVCIKTLTVKPRGEELLPVASTLCRDDESLNSDRGIRTENVTNWVYWNTAFKRLHTEHPEHKRIFSSNYLPLIRGYKNTSFEAYGGPSKWRLIRFFMWPLPYRNTIIASILSVPCISEDQTETGRVIGFLCVDCNSFLGAFHKKYDEVIIKTIADALSPTIQQYKLLQENNQPPVQTTIAKSFTTTQGGQQ